MKKSGNILGVAALLVVVGVIAFYMGMTLPERYAAAIKNLFTETKSDITGEIIKADLADIGELATEEYFYTEIETYDSSKKIKDFDIPFTKTKFVYSYDGTIKAGIDFATIDVDKDDVIKTVTVRIPKAKILSSEIDESSFKIYDEKQSIFNKLTISNFNALNADLKARAEEDAINRGVLERADINAVTLINNFLTSTYDMTDYAIKVETVVE